MNDVKKVVEDGLENEVVDMYFNSFSELAVAYDNAVDYLRVTDEKAYSIFYDWFTRDGKSLFATVVSGLVNEKIDNRFLAFMEIYKSYLKEAIEDKNKEIVLEFLYRVPQKMKIDFSDFGFLKSEDIVYTFNLPILDTIEQNCNYNMNLTLLSGFIILGKGFYKYGKNKIK